MSRVPKGQTPRSGRNGQSPRTQSRPPSTAMNIQGSPAFESISPTEIAKAANLFDALKQFRLKLRSGDEAVLERAFEFHVQGVLEKLDARIPQITDEYQKQVEVIMARQGLFDAAFQQIVLLCQSISPVLGDCVGDLRAVQSGFTVDFQHVIVGMNEAYAQAYDALSTKTSQVEQLEEDIRKLQDAMGHLNQENTDLNNQVLDLRTHLRVMAQDLNRHRDINQTDSKRAQYPPFDTSGGLASASVDSTVTPRRRNGSVGSLSVASPNYMRPRTPSRSQSAREEAYISAGFMPDDASSMGKAHIGLNTPSKGPLSLLAPANWLRSFREDVQRAMDTGRCRDISLKECVEMIEKIYESKAVANDKAMQNIGNIPMETLEQHLFRTLEKKYGLRDLAVVHAGMLLKALQSYATEDNDVAVFQRIFRNEVEEDFRLVQRELQKSIKDLTLVQIMGRYPSKDQASITAMLEQKMTTGVILEDEWRDMIGYLYNEVDSRTVCALLHKQAEMERELASGPAVTVSSPASAPTARSLSPTPTPRSGGIMSPHFHLPASQIAQNKIKQPAGYTIGSPAVAMHSGDQYKVGTIGYDRGKVRDVRRLGYSSRTLTITVQDPNKPKAKDKLRLAFPVFIKIILDFQLQHHEDYLSNFSKLFRHVDRNSDGVLSAKEFHAFFTMLRRVTEDSSMLAMLLQRPLSTTADDSRAFDFHELDEATSQAAGDAGESEKELRTLFSLIKMIDPHETDHITFSSAVSVLNHIQSGRLAGEP